VSEYVKSTNFTSKDSLAIGNPLKIIKGAEFDTEFNNIATAVATKADLASPALTGTPTAPTASSGTSSTQLATTAFVAAAITAYDTALTVSTSQIENDSVTADKIATGAVGAVELASDAVTQDKMAANSVGTAEIIDANVTPAKLSQPLTAGTALTTTSGTTASFTGIPSWVKRITVALLNVSTNGSSFCQLQLGAGSFATTGYTSTGGAYTSGSATNSVTSTTGLLILGSGSASDVRNVIATLVNISGNTWVMGSVGSNNNELIQSGGSVTLSGALDRIRLTTVNGTDTFDAGSINILYE
jgi:hypothetical protein